MIVILFGSCLLRCICLAYVVCPQARRVVAQAAMADHLTGWLPECKDVVPSVLSLEGAGRRACCLGYPDNFSV